MTAPLRLGAVVALTALVSTASPRVALKPGIERVATLAEARSVHTATTLPSGEVLLVAGMTEGGGSLASVELYDPRDNSVTALGTLAERRAGHTATLLTDGRVLVAGGYNGQYLGSVEVFDPATRRFSRFGTLVEGRSGHTATLLPDGRVLLVGGVGRGWTFLRSTELFDPATGRSEMTGAMAVPRESHTATLLGDGRVLVVGGHSGRRQDMEVYHSAEVFDPRTGRFDAAGTLGIARHKHDAVRLGDGRVLVIGGADRTDRLHYASTEIYDPTTGTFTSGPEMAHRRYKINGTSVLLSTGAVLVTSGARSAELLDGARSTSDVGRSAFRTVPGPFPEAYRFSAVAVLPDGDVIISGGYSDGNRNTPGIWRYRR